MYPWIRPKIAVPVHGEARHLHAHQKLAEQMGVPQVVAIENGDILSLAPGAAEVIDEAPIGRMGMMETDGLVEADADVFRPRRRLMNHGTIVVSVVMDGEGSVLAEPQLSALGAVEIERFGELRKEIADQI